LTETCTLLLDANGYCRSVLAASSSLPGRGGRAVAGVERIPAAAERCIGAQFVASLDFREPGGLLHMPEPGTPLLFARLEDDGRITLVRTAKLVSFETYTQTDSGVRENPRVSYGADEERTTPFDYAPDEITVPRTRAYTPSAAVASYSYPPPPTSMKMPTARGFATPRVTIPPPPAMPRTPMVPRPAPRIAAVAPTPPRRPSVARVVAPPIEAPTLPFRRVAR
jgi:hypothetical protein